MSAIKWSSKKPAEDLNGLEDLNEHFMAPQPEDIVAITIVRRSVRHLPDGDDPYPEVRFARIEPVLSAEDRTTVLGILERAYQARAHDEALDLGDVDDDARGEDVA
jgi:hypothetical protein